MTRRLVLITWLALIAAWPILAAAQTQRCWRPPTTLWGGEWVAMDGLPHHVYTTLPPPPIGPRLPALLTRAVINISGPINTAQYGEFDMFVDRGGVYMRTSTPTADGIMDGLQPLLFLRVNAGLANGSTKDQTINPPVVYQAGDVLLFSREGVGGGWVAPFYYVCFRE